MEKTRQNKISRLIQQDLGEIFLKEMKPLFGPSLISVTEVRITPDMSIARVFISVFPIGGVSKETVMQAIADQTPDIRRRLGLREGRQLRIIPSLEFYLDESIERAENIDRLLKGDL